MNPWHVLTLDKFNRKSRALMEHTHANNQKSRLFYGQPSSSLNTPKGKTVSDCLTLNSQQIFKSLQSRLGGQQGGVIWGKSPLF